ncbi:MAG TPA: DUF692 family protein [Vicinamibacterales bacterium]|nr:DUF692 family protein [Vicinamibacterales bacterium]
MPHTGVTLGDERTARWLEAHPASAACIEVVADGFFARPSSYLAWLGADRDLIVRAPGLSVTPVQDLSDGPVDPIIRLAQSTHARFVVRPLGFCVESGVVLERPAPINLTAVSLETVSANLRQATGACDVSTLIEPIAAPLSVSGSINETSFLIELCQSAGCRLLLDVATLLVRARNHGIDPVDFVAALPGELVAAVRIGGLARRGARWSHDARAPIDADAWQLLDGLLTRSRPEVVLLNHREGDEMLERELDLLRRMAEGTHGRASVTPSAGESMPAPGTAVESTERIAIAPDVALFVLDHAGVFFSSRHHELTLFNTSATLAWCLLEDGLDVPGIVDAFAKAVGVSGADAEGHVADILRQWFGRGYITHPGTLRRAPLRFSTALGWLLTNDTLRARFRESPQSVADQLGMVGEDRDTLLALQPDELDAQAEESAPRRDATSAAHSGDVVATDGPQPRTTEFPATANARPAHSCSRLETPQRASTRYRLLSTTFEVEVPSPALLARLHEALGHLSTSDAPVDVFIQVLPTGEGGWLLLENETVVAEGRQETGVVPAVKQQLRWRAVASYPSLMSLHAGVVSFGGGCMLLPAPTGSGKTTLTAALVRAGATYYSDEIAVFDADTLAVIPVPLSLTVKDGSLEPVRQLYPEVDTLTPHVREDSVRVRYLPPPAAVLPASGASMRARWIVFPRYAADAATSLHPIDRPTALRRLLEESYVPAGSLNRARVESLVGWMREVDCYELPFSSLERAVDLVRRVSAVCDEAADLPAVEDTGNRRGVRFAHDRRR